MTKKEFAIFASALRTYYPKENILPNNQALELWFNQLNDIPYKVAAVALEKWVATNKWSPSIADIREQTASVVNGEYKEWGEAWQEVLRAIRIYGSWQQDKALASLDETTRKVVKSLGFYNLCMSEEISVDRANFRMIYEGEISKQKQRDQLPPRLKELIGDMPNLLEEGGE